MTRQYRVSPLLRRVNGGVVRHFGRAVGKNWWMQPVSDGAGGRACGERREVAHHG